MANSTPLRILIEDRLGQSLDEFVAARRPTCTCPPPLSWRDIAREISEKTGVTVTHETLRLWAVDDEVPTPASAGHVR